MVEVEQPLKLFLGGLSPNSNEDSLHEFYCQFGEIADVKVIRDHTTGHSRGFGFITFKETSSVDRAQAARPHLVDGKAIEPKPAVSRPNNNRGFGGGGNGGYDNRSGGYNNRGGGYDNRGGYENRGGYDNGGGRRGFGGGY